MNNRISINKYHGFSDDLIGAIKFYAAGIVAIEDDVRLSKRLHIPSKRLRGFESRKVGPTDAGDFVGGNYATALNLEAALPNLLPEATQTDIAAFLDIANLWHVDYDSLSLMTKSSLQYVQLQIGNCNKLLQQHLFYYP